MQVLLSPRNDFRYFIIRSGAFHTRMSFLGCIGYNDRAITWHQMVDIALHSILLEDIIGSSDVDSDLLQETFKGNLDVDCYYY